MADIRLTKFGGEFGAPKFVHMIFGGHLFGGESVDWRRVRGIFGELTFSG